MQGANGGDEVPGRDRGEVSLFQADVSLLQMRLDPGLGASEGITGELGEVSAVVRCRSVTHRAQLAPGILSVSLAFQHSWKY